MRVEVYRNLHSGAWSIRALEGVHRGRVIAHAAAVLINDAQCVVNPAGRERVLRERRKNIHATIRGTLAGLVRPVWRYQVEPKPWYETRTPFWRGGEFEHSREMTYNPYMHSTFVDRGTLASVHDADSVNLFSCGTVRYYNEQ